MYLNLIESYLTPFSLFITGIEIYNKLHDKESDRAYRAYADLLFES